MDVQQSQVQPFIYDQRVDLRTLIARRKSRPWLKEHVIDLHHKSRVKAKDLPLLYRFKEAILPVSPGESIGRTLESGKQQYLKREDGTYFDRLKYQNLYDAAEKLRTDNWNTIYNSVNPSNNAIIAFNNIRNDAVTRLNLLNSTPEMQYTALNADSSYKKSVNKFLNRYNK